MSRGSAKPFKNLFKIPRYNYDYYVNGEVRGGRYGVNRALLKMDFEMYMDELHLGGDSGDTFTFKVTKP